MPDTTPALALNSKLYQRTCNQRCRCGQWLGLTERWLNHEFCLDCQLYATIFLLGASPDSPEPEYGWIQPGA